MIEVDLPDGSIAEFPDDTSPEVIKGALRKRFPAAQPGNSPVGATGEAGAGPLTAGEQASNREGKSNRADFRDLVRDIAPKWDMQGEMVDMMAFGLPKKPASGVFAGIDSALSAATGGPFNLSERYNNELEEFQTAQRQYNKEHPFRSLTGQGLGLGMGIAKARPSRSAGVGLDRHYGDRPMVVFPAVPR